MLSNGTTYQDGYHWFFIINTTCSNLNYDYSKYLTGWVAGEYVKSYWSGISIVNYKDRMTQFGTKYWADQGKDFRWILSYFYPNLEFFDLTPPILKFKVGDQVQTTAKLNVRKDAFINPKNKNDNIIWTAPKDSTGTIIYDYPEPQSSNGHTWWKIKWDANGTIGWSAQYYLSNINKS